MGYRREPTLRANPNEKAPLAALLRIETEEPVLGTVTIANAAHRHEIEVRLDTALDRDLAVAGMRPDTPHRIELRLQAADGTPLPSKSFEYTPPPLPPDMSETPPIRTSVSRPTAMEPGFLFLSIRRRTVTRAIWWTAKQKKFAQGWSMIVALDPHGEIVWTFRHDRRIAGLTLLPNGNIFFHQVDFHSFEIDLLGQVVRSWVAARRPAGPADGAIAIDVQSLHHQPHVLPNGNFIAMSANTRVVRDYVSDEYDPDAARQEIGVVGDRIIEFTPEGEVVWSWDAFDHLDVHRVGYHVLEPYWDTRGFPGHADWTHGNGVGHDPADDAILISLRHQDAVIKVDRSGAIRWIHGTHDGWSGAIRERLLTPIGDLTWHWHGHNPRITGLNTFIMYDNAILQARPYAPPKPPAECFARAVEFEVDEDRMETREIWSSRSGDPQDDVVSWAMGDAHRLPATDNRLVIDSFCLQEGDPLDVRGEVRRRDLTWNEWRRESWHPSDFSYWARIREYLGASGEIVFEARLEDPRGIMGWEVFGGAKAPAFGRGSSTP